MYSARAFADQYRQTRVSSAVLDADPHRVIAVMFTAARERTRLAAACIDRGDVARKGQAITEASTIVGSLSGALDLERGGEIADSLAALYDYLQRRLLEANLGNDPAILAEVDDLLGDIEAAWAAIAPKSAEAVAP
jgi:flagellar protein FliS